MPRIVLVRVVAVFLGALLVGWFLGEKLADTAVGSDPLKPDDLSEPIKPTRYYFKHWYMYFGPQDQEMKEAFESVEAAICRESERPSPDTPEWAREWSGIYSCGGGMGMHIVIAIGPDGRVVTLSGCCAGLCGGSSTRVLAFDELNSALLLEPGDGGDTEDHPLYLVRWGDRRYAVWDLEDFCRDVVTGDEGVHPGDRTPLRDRPSEDWSSCMPPAVRPAGLPQVPPFAVAWLESLVADS